MNAKPELPPVKDKTNDVLATFQNRIANYYKTACDPTRAVGSHIGNGTRHENHGVCFRAVLCNSVNRQMFDHCVHHVGEESLHGK